MKVKWKWPKGAFVVFISFHFTKLSEIEKKLNGNEASVNGVLNSIPFLHFSEGNETRNEWNTNVTGAASITHSINFNWIEFDWLQQYYNYIVLHEINWSPRIIERKLKWRANQLMNGSDETATVRSCERNPAHSIQLNFMKWNKLNESKSKEPKGTARGNGSRRQRVHSTPIHFNTSFTLR